MRPAGKVILTCATSGSAHTPTMNTDIPVTPEEMIDDAVAAARAGAGRDAVARCLRRGASRSPSPPGRMPSIGQSYAATTVVLPLRSAAEAANPFRPSDHEVQ